MGNDRSVNVVQTSGGMGFLGFLTLLFIALKLTGHIAWSWWWVLAPMWMPVALLVLALLVVVALDD